MKITFQTKDLLKCRRNEEGGEGESATTTRLPNHHSPPHPLRKKTQNRTSINSMQPRAQKPTCPQILPRRNLTRYQ